MATQTEKEMRIKVEASEVIFEISSKVTKAIHERAFEIARTNGREVVEKKDVLQAEKDIIKGLASQLEKGYAQ